MFFYNLYLAIKPGKYPFFNLLRSKYGTMLSTGITQRNRQAAVPFLKVVINGQRENRLYGGQ